MATITITDVTDDVVAELRREAESTGTTAEAIAAQRLTAWYEAGQEHESRNEQLLKRLRSGEPVEGELAQRLRQAREETGVWLTRAQVASALSESRR